MARSLSAWQTFSTAVAGLALMTTSAVADQTGIGPWNDAAAKLASSSALVTTSLAFIEAQAAEIKDTKVSPEAEDAVFNAGTCIKEPRRADCRAEAAGHRVARCREPN